MPAEVSVEIATLIIRIILAKKYKNNSKQLTLSMSRNKLKEYNKIFCN